MEYLPNRFGVSRIGTNNIPNRFCNGNSCKKTCSLSRIQSGNTERQSPLQNFQQNRKTAVVTSIQQNGSCDRKQILSVGNTGNTICIGNQYK